LQLFQKVQKNDVPPRYGFGAAISSLMDNNDCFSDETTSHISGKLISAVVALELLSIYLSISIIIIIISWVRLTPLGTAATTDYCTSPDDR
jgi:hypothetical protein